MKTTDLIPILLYHLNQGDKYGLELIECCKQCSDGKIVVKQPTLYSVLKKLEKSKFISSYWKDSEIGGKRHYFKLTNNGLAQLETYPSLDELIKIALTEENDENSEQEISETEEIAENKPSPSPFDNFSFDAKVVNEIQDEELISNEQASVLPEPKEEKAKQLPSPVQQTKETQSFNIFDAFDEAEEERQEEELKLANPFDSKTANEENVKLESKDTKINEFVNSDVKTFAKSSTPISIIEKEEVIVAPITPIVFEEEDIKFQDYVDIKTDKTIKLATKTARRRLYKTITSSLLSLIIIGVCLLSWVKYMTPIYAVCLIASTLYIVFYACNFIGRYTSQHYALGYKYNYPYKRKIVFRLCAFASIVGILLVINLIMGNSLFSMSNIGNFVAPIIIASTMFLDYLLSVILYHKI